MNTKNALFVAALLAVAAVFGIAGVSASQVNTISDSHTYTLTSCPVTGQPLDSMGEPVIETINDREVRFCCAGCIGKYRDTRADYEAAVNAVIIEQQQAAYPLDVCLVMDTALGSMGDPIDYVHQNRLVRFCCAGCEGVFEGDPEKFIEKVDVALLEKKRADHSPDDVCIVTGEPLGDTPAAFSIANQLLLLESEACVDAVRANPAQYLNKGNPSENHPAGEQHQHTPATENPGQSCPHGAHDGHQHAPATENAGQSCPHGAHDGHQHAPATENPGQNCPHGAHDGHEGRRARTRQQRESSCCG